MLKIIWSKGIQTRAKVGTGVMYHRLRDFFLSGQNISIRLVCVCVSPKMKISYTFSKAL